MGLRSGTENVPATIAFAAAINEAVKHVNSERKRLEGLKKQFHKGLEDLPNIIFLGASKMQLPSYLPIALPGLDAERLIFALEDQGIYLSTGAACAASKGTKSPTLQAIGLSDAAIAGSLRITMGKLNNPENIAEAVRIIRAVVATETARLNK